MSLPRAVACGARDVLQGVYHLDRVGPLRAAHVALVTCGALPDHRILCCQLLCDTGQGRQYYLAGVEVIEIIRGGTLCDAGAALVAVAELPGALNSAQSLLNTGSAFGK